MFQFIQFVLRTNGDIVFFPDRYVLMGNHRDASVFGAIDPSTGTAVMKEISRVMGNLVKSSKCVFLM